MIREGFAASQATNERQYLKLKDSSPPAHSYTLEKKRPRRVLRGLGIKVGEGQVSEGSHRDLSRRPSLTGCGSFPVR